ncbi:MAG: hypothetical protein MUF00_09965 [Gemmatimonadaceae bacterium]|jgi:hypothetical protein|nr:hypothetical protein [Gemmatimonadaceae bacterium]
MSARSRVALLLIVLLTPVRVLVAHPGWGLVHDPARRIIYFTDLTQVWAVDSGGRARVVVPHVHTHELRLDVHGTLYGEDVETVGSGARARQWQLAAGASRAEFTAWTSGWRAETGFVADSAGSLYRAVCDVPTDRCAVRGYRRDGRVETVPGADRFARPLNFLAATPRGAVLVADGAHILQLTARGPVAVARAVATDTSRFAIMGFEPLADGALLAAVYGDGVVLRVGADGARRVLRRSPPGWRPSAVRSAMGRLWITEYDDRARCRLVIVEPDGRARMVPT